ncbi:hypothetical protein AAHA92_05112 [Salvia divinorum]|uniref:Uncharacterized protein n=1 Tax=Salvia divinorum TaxID=28513 RepID=A0ABD1I2C1_SALDI
MSIHGRGYDSGNLNLSRSFPADDNLNTDSSRSSAPTENSSAGVSTSSHGNNTSTKERGKSSLRMLYFKGVAYHMVNWCPGEQNHQKETGVAYLLRVSTKHLQEEDVQSIFGQVITMLHTQIADAFSKLEITTPQAKHSLCCEVEHLLGCIRSLPSDNVHKSTTTPN